MIFLWMPAFAGVWGQGGEPPCLKPCCTTPTQKVTVSPADQLVINRMKYSTTGLSAIDIAVTHLEDKARRYSKSSLAQIGLSIAVRLIGEGLIEATRTNHFRIQQERAA